MVEDPLDAHLRAARRAQEDARRCSGDLRALAARYPGATARVLEIDPVLIARALSHNGLSELSVETIQGSVDTIEQAARGIAGLRAGSPSVGTAHVAEAGAFSARAHRAADRLCEALEAVSAATLGSPALTRADLAGSAETIRP